MNETCDIFYKNHDTSKCVRDKMNEATGALALQFGIASVTVVDSIAMD